MQPNFPLAITLEKKKSQCTESISYAQQKNPYNYDEWWQKNTVHCLRKYCIPCGMFKTGSCSPSFGSER
jgi:hypothetical protein